MLATASNMQAASLVGAIRWDAWHGHQGAPGKAVQHALSPKEWHHRLPFFAQVRGADDVVIDGTAQEVMDQEINYASKAALDYWAFLIYPQNDAMSLALKRYLSSTKRQKINFCAITESNRFHDEAYRRYLLKLMAEPGYLKVLDNRPVWYLGFLNEANLTKQWGSVEQFQRAINDFRATLREQKIADPYIVIMDFSPVAGNKWRQLLGAQALSSYAANEGKSAAPYRDLAAYAEKFWNVCKAQPGADVVPIVTAGWDRRPRIARPMPWETWQKPGANADKYYHNPTPTELAAHLSRALSWMQNNPQSTPAQLALIYAWNENDEGGWLVPTLGEGKARIDAIEKMLKP